MKIRLIKINVKIIFLSICFILFSINSFGYNSIQDGKIINIIDGDTVHFLKEGDTVYKKIRLVGIDAPELKQEFGKESRQCLVELIENQPVHLVKFGQDRYQRILAKIKIGQVDINLAMIKKGCAWYYRQYQDSLDENDQKLYDQAEQIAQRQFLGLFKNAKALPPWVWRKKN
jgi:micrococcal nuclease